VIKRYTEEAHLKYLIEYLEKLIDSEKGRNHHHGNHCALDDYNKDYTALLLNCYVKTKMTEKISQLIEKVS
jgi:hypothetical protein